MDYVNSALGFKVRKVIRYARLYGVERTYAKVQGQLHTRRTYKRLPTVRNKTGAGFVGIVGSGNYAFTTLAYYVNKAAPGSIRGAMDLDVNRAASLASKYRADYYTDSFERIVEDQEIKVVFIASNHASHSEYAVAALRAGKAVHVEKPHAVTAEQLAALVEAMVETGMPLSIGYNRPGSRLGLELRAALSGQDGAGMYNWFVAGHELPPDHWYYAESEGGRVLGNMCHWIDFLYQLVPEQVRYPITVTPTVADRADCDVAATYVFGDGSIGIVTFSAKGHTFEGVREYFSGHKGDVMVSLRDFQHLRIDCGERVMKWHQRHRDHGHQRRIVKSLGMVADPTLGDTVDYVRGTGELMLATRHALQSKLVVQLDA